MHSCVRKKVALRKRFRLPLTPDSDIAGVIGNVGTNVTPFSVRNAVFGGTKASFVNGYAQYARAKAGMIAAAPTSIDASAGPFHTHPARSFSNLNRSFGDSGTTARGNRSWKREQTAMSISWYLAGLQDIERLTELLRDRLLRGDREGFTEVKRASTSCDHNEKERRTRLHLLFYCEGFVPCCTRIRRSFLT